MENWGNGKENKMLDVLLLFLYFRFNFDLNREKKIKDNLSSAGVVVLV